MPPSETQINAIEWIPRFSATLSIVGSSCLVYLVKSKLTSTYNRLIFGLSVVDIVSSLWISVGVVAVPVESGLKGAHGNRATCSAQAFMLSFGILSALLYNASLMVYFYLTICVGKPLNRIEKRMEPFLHAVSVLLPLTVGIIGLALEVYNWGGAFRCWVAPFPLGCDRFPDLVGDCTRGEHFKAFGWAFLNVPLYSGIVLFYMAITRVYCKFRQTIRNSRRSSMTNVTANTEREVTTQCILYGLFFANTSLWFVILSILEAAGKVNDFDKIYPLVVLTNLFYPLQGFFNFFIYIRPNYLRIRRENESRIRLWAFCAVFSSKDDEATGSSSLGQSESFTSRLWSWSQSSLSYWRRSSDLGPEQHDSSDLALVTSSTTGKTSTSEFSS